MQQDLFTFKPTIYHHDEFEDLFRLDEAFLSAMPNKPQLFYIWGYAYEFDIRNEWARMEDFCRMISGHGDESQITAETVNYLYQTVFGTKMANILGINYGAFLKACAGTAEDIHTKRCMQKIVHYSSYPTVNGKKLSKQIKGDEG